jgi:hypothetical protein
VAGKNSLAGRCRRGGGDFCSVPGLVTPAKGGTSAELLPSLSSRIKNTKVAPVRAGFRSTVQLLVPDFDGSGLLITDLNRSTEFIEGDEGLKHRTAWAKDGMLFYDTGGDNAISDIREYVFTEWGARRSRNGSGDRFCQRTRRAQGTASDEPAALNTVINEENQNYYSAFETDIEILPIASLGRLDNSSKSSKVSDTLSIGRTKYASPPDPTRRLPPPIVETLTDKLLPMTKYVKTRSFEMTLHTNLSRHAPICTSDCEPIETRKSTTAILF